MPEPLFLPAPFFLLRVPTWSVEDCLSLLENKDWVNRIFQLYETENSFQEAVAIASPSLHAVLQRKDIRTEALAMSLLNYAVRMATRAIPFGLFSFVAMGSWGKKTDFPLDLTKLRKQARPNMAWIFSFLQKLGEKGEASFSVRTNPLIETIGGRFSHSYMRRAEKEGKTTSDAIFIRSSKLTERIFDTCKEPQTISSLCDHLMQAMPELNREKIPPVIQQLIAQQFLLPAHRPSLLDASPADFPYLSDEIRNKISTYSQTPFGGGISFLSELQQEMEALAPVKSALQVDAVHDGLPLYLSSKVATELGEAAHMLWKLFRPRFSSPALQAHHAQFIEKYGTYRTVPLLEFLSQERGLGPLKEAHLVSPSKEEVQQSKKWEQRLYPKWEECLVQKKEEILLTEEFVEDCPHDPQDAPNSFDFFCKIIADSPDQIDQGNFLLSFVLPTAQGGSTLGRFIDYFGPNAKEQFAQFFQAEEALEKEVLFFETSYWPHSGHLANVAVHPNFRKYRLDLESNAKDSHCLSLEEIYVGATSSRFYLTAKEGGKELVGRVGNLLNPKFAPAPLSFIREVSIARHQLLYPFFWGSLEETATFLPRVRFQRTILSPARWKLTPPPPQTPSEKMTADFISWANFWNLPRRSFLVRGDQNLLIDREHPGHLQEITQILKKGEPLQFAEYFPTPWLKSQKGHHLSELVVPFLKNPLYGAKKPLVPPPHTSVPIDIRRKPIGSEWLFIKFYLPEEGMDRFLLHHLAPLGKELAAHGKISGWFFVRYRDPETHLRFRLRLTDHSHLTTILKDLQKLTQRWTEAGLIREMNLGTYDREIERYGGEHLIDSIETLFCADSLTAISFLQDASAKKYPRPVLETLSVISFLKNLSHKEKIDLLNTPNREDLKGYREYKRELIALAMKMESFHTETERALSDQPNKLSIYDSLLHMHCNRIGCDLLKERRARLYALHTILQIERKAVSGGICPRQISGIF